MSADDRTATIAGSPAARGPSGPLFEAQVGAHYLLSMLAGGEPRGLPGTIVNRVEFQRGPDGRALDDVIILASDRQGCQAVLEIQVKRTVDFTSSDTRFRKIVAQIAKSATRPDFNSIRYELAVAIDRTSTKIERSYQEVLSWARFISTPEAFADHISRPGQPNDDMRRFVEVFRDNLKLAGATDDDEFVWRILRRFQILVFDFNQSGSASALLARERAAMVLAPLDSSRAGDLWHNLITVALESDARAGDYTSASLREILIAEHDYHFAGERRLSVARRMLTEASQFALADIRNCVGNLRINRANRIAEAYSALNAGNYVEIRGDAGVGKSGILKDLAERLNIEARAIILSPNRTPPGGWVSLRSSLNCDATARDLLSDMASDGGAVLFIDGADFFDDKAQRATVSDLVRAAAEISNFAVVVTARRSFGRDEPSWLPSEALDRLGRAPQVIIDDLDADEVDQLKAANISLAALLAKTHPARPVARNLFRLARLAAQTPTDPLPYTEADMAEQWWNNADGIDTGRRERSRLLKALAIHALTANCPMKADSHHPNAIEYLIASGTLRELHTDLVVFQHDVFRDWATGCLLHDEPQRISELPLDRPAPTNIVRGVELAARLAAERGKDGTEWKVLLDSLSQASIHGSWRRAVILAIVRSEIGIKVLENLSYHLFVDDGSILKDLIRITIAIDSEPGEKVYASSDIDLSALPDDFLVPRQPSWHRLILWSLKAMPHIPKAVIPDLVTLYSRWSMAWLGQDPITPLLLPHIHDWLVEMESALHPDHSRHLRRPFGINLTPEQKRGLETSLRIFFLAFCHCIPELAERYLNLIAKRRAGDQIAHDIMKFRGSAARAAPAALVDLALRTLIPEPKDNDILNDRHGLHGPFGVADHDFMPASPAQGPFLELLEHAPGDGLRLVRKIVEHAIKYYTRGRDCGTDSIVIAFPGGGRAFPWIDSYRWARDSNSCIVTSALMALEAWSHWRIEAGQLLSGVIDDVLGPKPAPAAFLLVAVDLLLSHWPKSKDIARPFLACPELLSLDNARFIHDSINSNSMMGKTAFMGLGGADRIREPKGIITSEALRKRPSRRVQLINLISEYAFKSDSEELAALRAQLSKAIKRLGIPVDGSRDMKDPRFAATHALNLANPENYQTVIYQEPDGSQGTGYQYQPPADEIALIDPIEAEADAGALKETSLCIALTAALGDRSKSSLGLVTSGVAWARTTDDTTQDTDDSDTAEWRHRTKVIAAALALRDGDELVRSANASWARMVFSEALEKRGSPFTRIHSRLEYNVVAIAAVGLINLLRCQPTMDNIRMLLDISAFREPSMALAVAAEAATLNKIDERLPRSLLRVGLAAQIRALPDYDEPNKTVEARDEALHKHVRVMIDKEILWLDGSGSEPPWPDFPIDPPRPKRKTFLLEPKGHHPPSVVNRQERKRPGVVVNNQGAAIWLRMSMPLVNPAAMDWFRELVKAYASWTAESNGVNLFGEESDSNELLEWNDAYFELIARCTAGLSPNEIDHFALDRIRELPDDPFLGAVPQFIRTIDELYFIENQIVPDEAVRIRSMLAQRLLKSRNWQWVINQNSSSIETHIAPAIAALFLHDYTILTGARCYLLPAGAPRLDSFMPLLTDITVKAARSAFVATLFLNLVELQIQIQHIGNIIRSAYGWLSSYPNDTAFWIDLEIGRRVCKWFDEVFRVRPDFFSVASAPVVEMEYILDSMLKIGVSSSRLTEETLTKIRL